MTILTPPEVFNLPSRLTFAPVANTQSGGRSPFDGTEQTLRQPGERWMATLGWEGLMQPEWRPLMAFLARLGGRAGRFTWSPPLPRRANGIAGRINWLFNSEFAGAGVGATGDGWSISADAGFMPSVIAAGIDIDGLRYIDLQFSGTPVGNTAGQIFGATNTPALPNQVWSASTILRIIGTPSGINSVSLRLREFAGGAPVGSDTLSTPSLSSLQTADQQRRATRTLGATATSVSYRVTAACTSGVPVSMVLRIKRAMLERTANTNAYIPTTAGAVTLLEGPFVNGAAQSGSALALRGFYAGAQAFLAGDLLSWTDAAGRTRLHMATADVTAAEDGTCTVPIAPPLRSAPIDGSTVAIASPSAVFRLAQDRNPMDVVRGLIAGGSLDIEEAVI